MTGEVVCRTESLCPICKKRLPGAYIKHGQTVSLVRACPDHGEFSVLIWKGDYDFLDWIKNAPEYEQDLNADCPDCKGLCPGHMRSTCCVVLPVTERCNLNCAYCFADPNQAPDEPFPEIEAKLKALAVPGQTLVQLSGGEPTMRDDLPDIVAAAKKAGCRYVQLNSNGIRLASDEKCVESLAKAGLSFVFMQFDGADDDVYMALRGRPMLDVKERAIQNCAKHKIGVTLVPTVVPGVNTDKLGGIVNYAISHSPAVRGVHLQPVSYFGRTPIAAHLAQRVTLDELLFNLISQNKALLKPEYFSPSCCDHPLCGFHSDFMVLPDGTLKSLSASVIEGQCCPSPNPAARNRAFVGKRWERRDDSRCSSKPDSEMDLTNMDDFLSRVKSHGFTITSMAFQDAASMDIGRLRMCSLHVYKDGKHIPFCEYYL